MVSLLAAVVACEEPKEIGLTPTTPVGVLYTDTLTITRTTIQLDSVRSQQQSSFLVGRYTDPQFGQIESRAYAQLSLNGPFAVSDSGTTTVTPVSRIILDSTKLRLPLNSIWYGDTTVRQELVLSRLTDSLRTTNYDISTPGPPVGQAIARRMVLPSPVVGDSLANQKFIVLDKSIGQELLALANTDAVQLSPTVAPVDLLGFRKRIARDFVITSNSPANAAMLGLTPGNCGIIVYYHVQGENSYPRSYIFPFNGLSSRRFNQITSKRTGVLASLAPGQSLPTTITGRTYVQPATGITTRLQFPGLANLIKSGRIAINRAQLVITPVPTEDSKLSLPPLMILSEVNAQNHLTRTDITLGGTYLFTVQGLSTSAGVIGVGPISRVGSSFVSPQTAFLDTRTNAYNFELGGYLQSVVAGISPNAGLAILTPSNLIFQSTQAGTIDATQAVLTDRVWRMTLEGKASVKLIIFYTTSN